MFLLGTFQVPNRHDMNKAHADASCGFDVLQNVRFGGHLNMCVVIQFANSFSPILSVMARVSFSFTDGYMVQQNKSQLTDGTSSHVVLASIDSIAVLVVSEQNQPRVWCAMHALYFHAGDNIMTSWYVQYIRWIKMPCCQKPALCEWSWLSYWYLTAGDTNYIQLPSITRLKQNRTTALLQVFLPLPRDHSLWVHVCSSHSDWYILLSLTLDHFGSREREAYRITFCDSLKHGELCTTRSRLAKPLWNMSAVPTSWHHNPKDQNNMSLLVFGINRRQMMRKGL